ncbi:MAG: FtsX-like permease family protein [Bacteroidota bacterium]
MQKAPFRWLVRMAWRDSRRNKGRLFLFISSILLGIAALVAINSFSENLQKDIEGEAKTLLGADLVFQANQAANNDIQQLLDSIGGQQAASRYFVSMAYFPKAEGTRLVQVRALEGPFPFYGKFATVPKDAYLSFRKGRKALVDKTLMYQFDLEVGDSIKLGELTYEIEGQLNSSPGRAGIAGSIAPAVYIPMETLEATDLIKVGSRVFYQYYLKLPTTVDIDALTKSIDPRLEAASFNYETVDSRKQGLGEAFQQMANFLNLVGFIALLLGCIGVASAVHIYIKDKIATVAILRCLGASGRQAFLIYLLQIAGFALIGSIAGALLGSGLQVLLPLVLSDFLPVENVSADLSWDSIWQGVFTGLSISILFALIPLLGIRKTSPLRTLRASASLGEQERDPWRWLVFAAIALFVTAFSFMQTGGGRDAISFPIGLGVAFLLLAGVAKLVVWLVRKYFPTGWSYVSRQSIANLYRPNNQTLTLIVSIGLGSALISTLFFVQGLLLSQVELSGSEGQPNMILFDIQPKQQAGVNQLAREYDLPIIQQVPIITMRLDNIDGINKMSYLKDSTSEVDEWVYNREYRVTYRDTLIESESILEGEWRGQRADDGTIYVSVEEGYARSLDAKVGTRLTFNVQGALIETVVGSIRKVDWGKIQTNFFLLFPTGILEKAPQFRVLVSRVESIEQSAKFQQSLVTAFPNVSVIDLGQILETVDTLLSKVSFVIRFMALFSILTGLMVLISSVALSKYQRIKESVLLRTIGASRSQILWINVMEYGILGAIATLTGIILALLASWLLALFSFNIPFRPDLWPPLVVFICITGITMLIGYFNSRDVVRKPPLEVLRVEL